MIGAEHNNEQNSGIVNVENELLTESLGKITPFKALGSKLSTSLVFNGSRNGTA